MDDDGRLAFTPAEAGRRIGLARTKVFEEIRAGKLRARKCGQKTLVAAEDLRAYLDALPERWTAATHTHEQAKSARRKSHAR